MTGVLTTVVARPPGEEPAWPHARRWAYVSGGFRALGHRFVVRTDDPVLGEHVARVLAPFAVLDSPDTAYSVVDQGTSAGLRWALYWQEERLATTSKVGRLLAILLWHVNRSVVASRPDLVFVHAAGVERNGMGIALPAPTESGKTTLAAWLVRTGLRYLTDEAVAIDPASRLVQPYPKALSVDPGSWDVLAELEPAIDDRLGDRLEEQWQVPATDIRPDALAPPVPLRFVVAPRYVRGAATTLEPLRPAEGLLALAECLFDARTHGRRKFAALADVVADCSCYRLTVGDLHAACAAVLELLEAEVP